ncbi:GTP pyrophosphokinase [Lachnospira multipara]|uniref:Putative GTP pyrophosphokinase n=1 Tax=Lachnospira multipara TaxID=28051 RepID=A0A1H5W485_9FIRM|nr:GTP pyrophosphokinase family protein [Lachnospira multipara]SEF93627.1 putative GTP pyrophosphokinase [Lachnospira multipara]
MDINANNLYSNSAYSKVSDEYNAKQIARMVSDGEIPLSELERVFKQTQQMLANYKCAMLEVETKFKVLNEQFSLDHERNPISSISTRLKSPQSIAEKLRRKNIPLGLNSIEKNMYDVAGVRVVCSFVDDVYFLADCLLQQDDVRLIQRKDYIKEPKSNGYRSLHLIIETPIFLENEKRYMKVEVQLRTIAMEFWANLDHKMRYKKDMDPVMLTLTSNELYQCASLSADLDRRMQAVRDMIEGSKEKK